MTREEREEAINEIKQIQCFDKPFDNSVEECNKFVKREMALNMAIKALEQEPCEDVISRQAVLDVVFESRKNFNNEFDQGFFADKIRDLPPVQPQPKRIRNDR